ncbi:MAG: IS5/IS1182 family transposase, partial [Geminicoccaceae bacterium]
MKRFIEGDDRTQRMLFPSSLDEYIDDENMVQVIDAFVDALDLSALGFSGVDPKSTG